LRETVVPADQRIQASKRNQTQGRKRSACSWKRPCALRIRRWRNAFDRPMDCLPLTLATRTEPTWSSERKLAAPVYWRDSLRRTRKEGTDVGWRLRADLHHDGGPAACCSGVACGCRALIRRGSSSWNPSPPRRRWAGSAGRSRSAAGSPARSRRSCGPVDQSVDATRFECWWPLARGNPASIRKLARSRRKVEPAEGSRTGTACTDKKAHARGDGRRKFLPVMHRTGSFAPRHARGHPFVDAGSSGERWQHRFGMNGQEEADPSDGERLPTRSKPS
jgi:hypothetical protein